MSEVFPYHQAEQVDEIIDLKTMLLEEMRMYPTEAEFRLSIIGLNRLYEDTPFELMIADFAQVAAEDYSDFIDKPTGASKWENMFYAGGVLGLHLASYGLPDGLAAQIHEMYDAEVLEVMGDGSVEERTSSLHILGTLEEIHMQEFDAGDTEVIEQAALLYDSDSDEGERYFFALGYRFAVDRMASLSEEFEEYDYLVDDYEGV